MSFPLSASLPLWRAHQVAAASTDAPARSTGFAALDAVLPGGGWPGNALTELLLDAPGAGELRLLAPGLAAATAPVLWVAPPLVPYAPALTALVVARRDWQAEQAHAFVAAIRAHVDILRRMHPALSDIDLGRLDGAAEEIGLHPAVAP